MSLTYAAFARLGSENQLRLVLTRGTYLTWRWCHAGDYHLYYLPTVGKGLFAELRYDPGVNAIRLVRSFADAAPLADYVSAVQLPG